MYRSGSGHEEWFPPTRLSAGYGFRKETIAGVRRNGREAPMPAARAIVIELAASNPKLPFAAHDPKHFEASRSCARPFGFGLELHRSDDAILMAQTVSRRDNNF